jgi:hypothetical protein
MHALMQQKLALAAIDHDEVLLQLGTLAVSDSLEQKILPELGSNDVFFGMILY